MVICHLFKKVVLSENSEIFAKSIKKKKKNMLHQQDFKTKFCSMLYCNYSGYSLE